MKTIEKIRQKIEELYEGEAPAHDQQCEFEDGYFTGIATISKFLDTLEEKSEKPTNLDDLLDDYFEKLVVPEHQIIFEDTYRKIATDFYEFCETRMKEQMMKDYIPKETAKKIARGSLGVQDFIRKIDKYEEDKQ